MIFTPPRAPWKQLAFCCAFVTQFTVCAADRLFPPDAVVNVRDYGAIPNDKQDDTAAIQKAITENVGTGRSIYFPAGTYDLSDTLRAKNKQGKWEAHITLQGQNRETTILRLKDNAPGFGDETKPKALYITGSHWEDGDTLDGGGNKAFRNNVRDLTLDLTDGNAGAIGIEWAVSNQGTIRDVTIRSDDGKPLAGIAMKRRIPGPGYIKNVTIDGCKVGIDVHDLQYGFTLEDIDLQKQLNASLRITENLVYANRLSMDCAAQTYDPKSFLLLVPRAADAWAAVRGGGPVLWFPPARVPSAPEYRNDALTDWQPVGPRLEGEPDDTAAIQRAIDAGKPVVYFPIKRDYFLSDTVTLRGKVRHVLGMGVEISLGAAKEPFSNKQNPRPLFRIDPVDGDDLTIENCFFNAQYPGEVIFENNSPKTLILKHCAGWVGAGGHRRSYQNTPAGFGGTVFIEDCFLPGWRFEKQEVWARQFNPENLDGDGVTPQVANVGGKLWILGFKTEGPAPFIHTVAGGTTELLGAYNYISATTAPKVPADSVPYIVEDSTASLTFATDNFRPDSDYRVYIREIRDGKVVKEVTRDQMPPRNGVKGDRSFVVTRYRTK